MVLISTMAATAAEVRDDALPIIKHYNIGLHADCSIISNGSITLFAVSVSRKD